MKLFTASQSRQLDQFSETLGVSTSQLMAKAGQAIANLIMERASPVDGPIVFFVGKGNNGGDALVAAKHLKRRKYFVVLVEKEADLKAQEKNLKKASWIVDGLLGTGLNGEVKGWYREAIDTLNSLQKKVLSIDIPSGLSADRGIPLGGAVRARVTASLGGVKLGLVLFPGSEYSGTIFPVDIGIPKKAYAKVSTPYHLLEVSDFRPSLKPRPKDSHKKDFGHLLVIAGSTGMPGAGFLASLGALRAGCGVVTYALPEKAYKKFDPKYPEVMMAPIPDEGKGFFTHNSIPKVLKHCEGKRAVLLGPGLGMAPETKNFVKGILCKIRAPLLLDADGLNAFPKGSDLLKKRVWATIATPHPGEMANLFQTTTDAVQKDRVRFAIEGAKRWKLCLVLKGYRSLIATEEGELYVNPTGNPGMATAGMGDLLGGVIAGLIAQGISPSKAALAGVYIHGLAGDMVREKIGGERGMITTDVASFIPNAIHLIKGIKH